MYIPDFNRVEDRADMLAFVRANPFAILVSNSEHGPFATHLPILVRESGDQMFVHGHMAKANPHWGLLENGQESLVIFHGPHAYISPSLYEARENVPTWNYAAVHVYGRARLVMETEHLLEEVRDIIHVFEPAYFAQWESLTEKFRHGMLKHIVGFEMAARRIEAKFKLSQNRSKVDQASVMASLAQGSDSNVKEIAQMMEQQGLGR
ncbi:MAG TPA: FMN-binding negative transcriptional regulator [Terriglobales bacterium]|nr:FMN-binding negative transcriptional regulator [Terriglobales bacterium]